MMKKRKSGTVKKSEEEQEKRSKVAAAADAGKKRIACSSSVDDATVKEVAGETSRDDEVEMRWPGGWMKRAGVVVDQQMPWGALWLPSWDVDYMGDAYVSALYSDVWEGYDDIWGFRT